VTRGFGGGLQRALSSGTKNRFLAVFYGALVTTLLQSSTAAMMLVSSFAGDAMLSLNGALALILGANIGTTLVAQALVFDLSMLIPVCFIIGVFLFSMDEQGKAKNAGRVLIGIGLILMSLHWIGESCKPVEASQTLPLLLQPLAKDNVLAIVVSALLTWMAHSSLAIVLLLMTLASNTALPVSLALIMVLGANLGSTIAPLVASLRDSPAALRVQAGCTFMRLAGIIGFLPFMTLIGAKLQEVSAEPTHMIVNFHTLFNVVVAIVFLPLTPLVAHWCTKMIPDRPDADDPAKPKYLNEHELATPAIALAAAGRETLRMADALQGMLEDTIKAFNTNDEGVVHRIRERDNIIDGLYSALKRYMAKITQEYMSKEDAARYILTLTFATNLEHAGDVIDKNLMPMALKKIRNQRSFSQRGFQEIETIHNSVLDSVRLAQNVFITGDIDLARKLIQEKEKLRRAEIQASVSHIDRLREGIPETIATTSLHLDIIRDYRRINSYMCTVAYPLLEEKGELVTSRLKAQDDK
jgi:phosphate:Na+ symporter